MGKAVPAAAARRADALDSLLQRFDDVLLVTGRASTTRRLYRGAVRRWLLAGGDVHKLDQDALQRFLYARRQHVGPSAMNIELKALRAFYRTMALLGTAPAGLDKMVPRGRRVPKRGPRWLTDSQVGAILAQPDLATFTGLRDHVLIRLLYETGLRASECAALRCGDVLPDGSVFVDRGKGGCDRYVPISPGLTQLLDNYTEARATLRPGNRTALWLTHRGIPIRNGRSVWEIVNRHARAALGLAAGFEKLSGGRRKPWTGQYPHMLRASFASALLHSGCPLPAIQQMMGHACLDTTGLYLGTDISMLQEAIEKHPRFSVVTGGCN